MGEQGVSIRHCPPSHSWGKHDALGYLLYFLLHWAKDFKLYIFVMSIVIAWSVKHMMQRWLMGRPGATHRLEQAIRGSSTGLGVLGCILSQRKSMNDIICKPTSQIIWYLMALNWLCLWPTNTLWKRCPFCVKLILLKSNRLSDWFKHIY